MSQYGDLLDRLAGTAAHVVRERRGWCEAAATSERFTARGGIVYPYDILDANLDVLLRLMSASGFAAELNSPARVMDIGCSNGDLSFAFALAGHDVTAVDWAFRHDQAPVLVSEIADRNSLPLAVVDMSVDRPFRLDDLRAHAVREGERIDSPYDLAICFGLLYHLKNPFAFLESVAKISRRLVLGTHLVTHAPGFGSRIDDHPLAYLVDAGELNGDPTNYWMLSEKAFRRIVQRSGFSIEASLIVPNNELGVSTPDRTDYGVRGFLALRSTAF